VVTREGLLRSQGIIIASFGTIIVTKTIPQVVALLATYNEERFLAGCLEHLLQQNLQIYLIDNSSTDQTAAIARRYLGHGLIGLETFPRMGMYSWHPLLERKERLANTLDADWFMNLDADEIRLSPHSGRTLAEAFGEVEQQGYNAVNFQEFTFIPTREQPDHDHQAFRKTMRRYYPFMSAPVATQVKAWKRQDGPVEFAWSGGHKIRFEGLRISPQNFVMKHYLFLSVAHARRKYIEKTYDPGEVEAGWHRARAALRPELVKLPAESELRAFLSDDELDAANPRARHYLFDADWAAQQLEE
jgi:glycosyltransferase involved in cell wall biosynthesis